jgi:uncharacterized surface protein with fasciclin (FAS1) repeats
MTTKKCLLAFAAAAFLALSASAQKAPKAPKDPKVGKVKMDPNKTIFEDAELSPIHKTLVAGIKAGGLVETLNSPFLYTVFAPTDAAFNKLPAGTIDTLTMPESKPMLIKILTYHCVQGKITIKDIQRMIKDGHGTATLKTVEGENLTFTGKGKKLVITDAKGGKALIIIPDVFESNGVTHVIDAILMP